MNLDGCGLLGRETSEKTSRNELLRANDEPSWITMSSNRETAAWPSGASMRTLSCSTSRSNISRMNFAKPGRAKRL